MREIKFRGKSLATGEWLYGDLLRNEKGAFAVVPPFKMNAHNECSDYEVNPDTIGQYTGLKDKNGREIYEGDVVRFLDADNKVKNEEVRFGGGGFTPVVEICWMADIEGMFVEVIGNIHDNPELLEED